MKIPIFNSIYQNIKSMVSKELDIEKLNNLDLKILTSNVFHF